ncbi:MAG TPA: hypothetical protein VFQ85_17600 [Mycobacteriales bacterium]|nr:hypothetical protein [Mycobacteriales bacterium]
MIYVDIAVRLEPQAARERAVQELEARKFRLAWQDEWYGVAEKGSKGLSLVLGALAQYFKVGIRVMGGADGVTVVRFEKLASGWMSGWIGAIRANNQVKSLRDDVARAFEQQGVLVGVSEA